MLQGKLQFSLIVSYSHSLQIFFQNKLSRFISEGRKPRDFSVFFIHCLTSMDVCVALVTGLEDLASYLPWFPVCFYCLFNMFFLSGYTRYNLTIWLPCYGKRLKPFSSYFAVSFGWAFSWQGCNQAVFSGAL